MSKLLKKVNLIEKVILRGCKNYEDFLILLKKENVPFSNLEVFVDYMVNKFYVNDDFFSILKILKDNLDKFEGYEFENILFRDILKEIMKDYVDFLQRN